MIKNAKEMLSEIKHQMRGGKGNVEVTQVFMQNEIKGKARLIARITLSPGSSIGMHQHVAEEELYYILSGKGIVNDNGEVREVSAGDAVMTGNGASHSIENREDVPLLLLAVILVY